MNRRTSIYTLHLPGLGAADLASVAERIPVLQDHGSESLSYRAANDAAARSIATYAAQGVHLPWHITTGLGIHRRTVGA